MANAHPLEAQLFERIKAEKITVPVSIWQLIYHIVADNLSMINLVVGEYARMKVAMPFEETRSILNFTSRIREVFDKIKNPKKITADDHYLQFITEKQLTLHPVIRELFGHYIGNDVQSINFCVSFYADPMDPQMLPVEEFEKILNRCAAMKDFLERLRVETMEQG